MKLVVKKGRIYPLLVLVCFKIKDKHLLRKYFINILYFYINKYGSPWGGGLWHCQVQLMFYNSHYRIVNHNPSPRGVKQNVGSQNCSKEIMCAGEQITIEINVLTCTG